MTHWLTSSSKLAVDPAVASLLGAKPVHVRSLSQLRYQRQQSAGDICMVGWGFKSSSHKARAWAQSLGVPFYQLEEGFIAYLGHPSQGDQRFSLIFDRQGIYYQAGLRCDFDDLLENLRLDGDQPQRISSLIDQLLALHITKYNHQALASLSRLQNYRQTLRAKVVLVVESTPGCHAG